MNFQHRLGGNSCGTHKRQHISGCGEGSKSTSQEDFKQKLLACSNGQSKGIDDLPPAILTDIISRLPLKTILQTTLVCWRWYRVTKDPVFIKLQLIRSKPQLILQPVDGPVKQLALVSAGTAVGDGHDISNMLIPVRNMQWKDFTIMCSYNGLLCIARRDTKADPLSIYNPITNRYMALPNSVSKRVLSNYVVCLGSSSSGGYKIIRYYTHKLGSRETWFEILTLGNEYWRDLSVPLLDWEACRAIFHNGVFFVTMMRKVPRLYCNMCIVAIDAKDETVQVIPFKEEMHLYPFLELLEFDGKLNIIEHIKDTNHVWVLEGDKAGEFSFQHEGEFRTSDQNRAYIYDHKIICKLEEDKYLMQQNWNHRFVQYCVKGRTYTNYFFQQIPFDLECKAFHFKPSLVSPSAAAARLC